MLRNYLIKLLLPCGLGPTCAFWTMIVVAAATINKLTKVHKKYVCVIILGCWVITTEGFIGA